MPNFRKMPFDHSFLSEGVNFSVFFNSFFYHPSLIYKSMLCEGVAVALKLFFYYLVLLCHSVLLGKTILPLFTSLGGLILYLCIHFFQESLLSSFMFLSCQTLENAIRPFIPYWRAWFLCILILPFSSLFYWNLLFWPLSYWNLYFLYFSIEISTFSLLFYWNLLFLYFLNTF